MWLSQTPVYLFQKLYPSALFQLDNPQHMALTFDDGPTPYVTEFVLEVLNQYHIPATFFCVGENIQKHHTLFQKMLDARHAIGNHTFSHRNGWKTSLVNYLNDIQKFNAIYSTPLFRPPYGKIRYSQYQALLQQNYKIVFWSVISYDYHSDITPTKCLNLLKKHTIGGQIILFHDSQKSFRLISKVLPEYLLFCQKLNLTFVPLK